MGLGTRHRRLRCLTVWWTATGGALLAASAARPGVADTRSLGAVDTLDHALADGASWALLLCTAWLWTTTTAAVVEALRSVPHRPGPRSGVRRWVLLACGVAAVSGTLPPAVAEPGHHRPAMTALPYPDRAVAPHRRRDSGAHRPRTVEVRPGDCLWSIARRDLGAAATDAEVTLRWHRIYAANHRLIGPDPDLIGPGLRLLLPGKDPS